MKGKEGEECIPHQGLQPVPMGRGVGDAAGGQGGVCDGPARLSTSPASYSLPNLVCLDEGGEACESKRVRKGMVLVQNHIAKN